MGRYLLIGIGVAVLLAVAPIVFRFCSGFIAGVRAEWRNIRMGKMTNRTLTDGSPVTPDHREIDPATGMQKAYVVLSAEERAKGFVKPVRRTYVHAKCGVATTMGQALAETYARNPYFYSGTFCVGCRKHFTFGDPDGLFHWDDGEVVGSA